MMSGNIENGREYLLHVMECLKKRLAETDAAILEGEKEIEDMHEYYWENYTEMDEYGYENFDNQQALFRQMNANEEQFLLRKRFKKMMDSPMRHLPVFLKARLLPNGSTRSAMEK